MAKSKTKSILPRSAAKPEDTWDLTPLYKEDAAWERAFRKLERMTSGFERFRGRLNRSAKTIRACFDFEAEFEKLAERVGARMAVVLAARPADAANPTLSVTLSEGDPRGAVSIAVRVDASEAHFTVTPNAWDMRHGK